MRCFQDMPKVSVIVPAYNAEQTLAACLMALFAVDYSDYEVIVVDDASTDRTPAIAAAYPCRLVRLTGNRGAGEARNQGVCQAQGEIIAFTDSDCIVPVDWLKKLVCVLQNEVVGVTGIYAEPHDSSLFARFVGYDIRLRLLQLKPNTNLFGTYNGAVLRSVFNETGGFDPRIRGASWEDVEFGLRIIRNGHQLAFDKSNAVVHQPRITISGYLQRQASRAGGQLLLHRYGRRNDYVDWSLSFHLLTTLLLFLGFIVLPWLGWLAALAILIAGIGLILFNRQLLTQIFRREGGLATILAGAYVLMRNASWIAGILWALTVLIANSRHRGWRPAPAR